MSEDFGLGVNAVTELCAEWMPTSVARVYDPLEYVIQMSSASYLLGSCHCILGSVVYVALRILLPVTHSMIYPYGGATESYQTHAEGYGVYDTGDLSTYHCSGDNIAQHSLRNTVFCS